MKIMTLLIILGILARFLLVMPAATLPEYPVMGSMPLERGQKEPVPVELRYMSDKMYYLKTGRLINTEFNYRKQQNFWGPGVPTNVRFPIHLAMWEEARRTGIKKEVMR